MNTFGKLGIATLLAAAVAAPLALAQDQTPEAPAAGEAMPGMGEGGMPGMMGDGSMMSEGGMPMMRMMQKMEPMMDACMAMMNEAGEPETVPAPQGG